MPPRSLRRGCREGASLPPTVSEVPNVGQRARGSEACREALLGRQLRTRVGCRVRIAPDMAPVLLVCRCGRGAQRSGRCESALVCRRRAASRCYHGVRNRKGTLDHFQWTDVETFPANGTDAAVLQARKLGLCQRFGFPPVVLPVVLEPDLEAPLATRSTLALRCSYSEYFCQRTWISFSVISVCRHSSKRAVLSGFELER